MLRAYVSPSPARNDLRLREHARHPKCERRTCLPVAMSSANASGSAIRSKIVRAGIEAALDDYVTSGSNVALGGGDGDCTAMLVEALAVRVETGALIDIAFTPVSLAARAAHERFKLPADPSVNQSHKIDLFIAPVSQMDQDLNATIGGSAAMSSERYAASVASKSILVIHEEDYAATSGGLNSFPVLVDPIMPDLAASSLEANEFLSEIGVRGAIVRKDGSNVVDVLLRPRADIIAIDATLNAFPGIVAVGILPTSERMTAVVTCEEQTYDITSSLANIAELAKRAGTPKRLSDREVTAAIERLGPGWSVRSDGRDAMIREFRFGSPDQTSVFIAHVLRIAKLANSFPEITTTFNRVSVQLHTLEAHGVTELDVSFAREIEHVCEISHGCSV
jgi:pterin-4a-carbinolamine dehydratase/ribose 5-phosphate isomerase